MATIKELMGINRADFSTAEKDLSKIVDRFLSNEEIVKLLYYTDADCLSNPKCVVNDEILEEVAKENLRIIPSLKIPENKGSYIVVTFDNFTTNLENPEFMNNNILVDVLCPVDLWLMDSYMLRPFHLMHQVQRELNNKTLNGIGKVYLIDSNLLNLGDYVGYQMAFRVINDV